MFFKKIIRSFKRRKDICKFFRNNRIKSLDNRIAIRHLIKDSVNINVCGHGNQLDFAEDTNLTKCDIMINGENNKIIFASRADFHKNNIAIYGDNNIIEIGSCHDFKADIMVGITCHNKVNNSRIRIGNECSSNGISLLIMEPDSSIVIGDDCMFSSGIEIWASDTHSVTDLEGNLLNYGKDIEIGNHVWVGLGVKIGKNVKIADNSLVGWGSVVTKRFEEPNVVIAGVPAQVVKKGINWDRRSPYNYKHDYLK